MFRSKMIKPDGRKSIFILTVIWMVMIFLFSAQPAEKSTETSLFIGQLVEAVCVPGFLDLSPEEKRVMAEDIDFVVRKTAHATEYAILGALLCMTVGEFLTLPEFRRYRLAYILGTLYAVTDEIHQLFVPGRSCMLMDVFIDSAGVLAGVLAVYVLKKITEKVICRKRLSVA